MSEPPKKSDAELVVTLTVGDLRALVRQEVRAAQDSSGVSLKDRDWVTAAECEKLYGVKASWFKLKGRTGEIPTKKAGKYVLFQRRAVEKYLEESGKKESND